MAAACARCSSAAWTSAGGNGDRVGDVNTSALNLYKACAALYALRTKPLLGIADHISDDGSIDWLAAGHYSLEVVPSPNGQEVYITCKKLSKIVFLVAGPLADGAAVWRIHKNWSLEPAYIQVAMQRYLCKAFFSVRQHEQRFAEPSMNVICASPSDAARNALRPPSSKRKLL